MIQRLNDWQAIRYRAVVAGNVLVAWVCCAVAAVVARDIGATDPDGAGYLGALMAARGAALAVLATVWARRGVEPRALAVLFEVLAGVQAADALVGALSGRWGQVSALAVVGVHLVSARWLRRR